MTNAKLEDRRKSTSLSEQVTVTLKTYFNTLEDQSATDVYEMVLQQVEKPLIEFVLQQTENNQTHAANILGINRNTLKKKMQKYDLDAS
ncbi:helix-turn-helix domain-containing protein [Thiomicrorhabdus sp. Milos-T2]|uniref:helix-turn-helix domain-containing protein n=1 Tax=Thiomicrorhabdus sp. Milos-T2 TaxID=90814 RepID=UPI0004949EC2|nr:helix-turn-helix domain-containing protein [Thiomicrorhabdus sp. Milos-T2]